MQDNIQSNALKAVLRDMELNNIYTDNFKKW
jgi:hypothetical protein